MRSCLLHFDDEIMPNSLKVMSNVPAWSFKFDDKGRYRIIFTVIFAHYSLRWRVIWVAPNPVFMKWNPETLGLRSIRYSC